MCFLKLSNVTPRRLDGADLGLGLGDAREEDQVGQEEADAEVQVDGGARALDGAAEREGEDAQRQAQQGDHQAQLGQQHEAEGVLGGGSGSRARRTRLD